MNDKEITKEELLAINRQLIDDIALLQKTNQTLENKFNEAVSEQKRLRNDYLNLQDENGALKKRINEVERDIQELIKQSSVIENINYLRNL